MADDLSIPPGASEAEVADTIVSARKSWKTVKGKSEPVWPPPLEKALVKALLQYKPTDSRYARALGRFPKRNRFISDYIFEQTGQRRTPKQVGSRLQQLKDVNCGKQLLSHVASWSLGPPPAPPASSGIDGLDFANQHQLSINPMSALSDCSPSPTSPFPLMRTPFGSDQSGLSPLSTSFYSPNSQYASLPVTPQVRRLDVFLPYDPATAPSRSGAAVLMRFSGCLVRPESVQAENEAQQRPASSHSSSSHSMSPPPRSTAVAVAVLEREPKVTFTAREPIAASSVVNVWVEGGPADDGSGASARTAHREVAPLVCIGTPSLLPTYGEEDDEDEDGAHHQYMRNTRAGSRAHHQQAQQAPKKVEYFSYSTQLVSNAFWDNLRRDANLSKYSITQDLVYQLDTPTARRGESFLQIVYRFVPTSTPFSSPTSHASQLRAARARGSASPASSVSSHSSTSPASLFQLPLHQHQQHQHHHHQQQQQQQYMQQQQMLSQGLYAANSASQLGMALPSHHGMHNTQMLPPMMGLASSSCSSTSSGSSAGMHQAMQSRHGSPHDHLYTAQQLQTSPVGSPLSAGFPSLARGAGVMPVGNMGSALASFDDDFGPLGVGVGVGVGDFGFATGSTHGSPLALA